MIDRCSLGVVTDFIDFCAFPQLWKWIFNIADCAVTIGGGMMVLWLIVSFIKEIKAGRAAKAEPPVPEQEEQEEQEEHADQDVQG